MAEQVYNPGNGFRQGSHFGNGPAPGNGGFTVHKGMGLSSRKWYAYSCGRRWCCGQRIQH